MWRCRASHLAGPVLSPTPPGIAPIRGRIVVLLVRQRQAVWVVCVPASAFLATEPGRQNAVPQVSGPRPHRWVGTAPCSRPRCPRDTHEAAGEASWNILGLVPIQLKENRNMPEKSPPPSCVSAWSEPSPRRSAPVRRPCGCGATDTARRWGQRLWPRACRSRTSASSAGLPKPAGPMAQRLRGRAPHHVPGAPDGTTTPATRPSTLGLGQSSLDRAGAGCPSTVRSVAHKAGTVLSKDRVGGALCRAGTPPVRVRDS